MLGRGLQRGDQSKGVLGYRGYRESHRLKESVDFDGAGSGHGVRQNRDDRRHDDQRQSSVRPSSQRRLSPSSAVSQCFVGLVSPTQEAADVDRQRQGRRGCIYNESGRTAYLLLVLCGPLRRRQLQSRACLSLVPGRIETTSSSAMPQESGVGAFGSAGKPSAIRSFPWRGEAPEAERQSMTTERCFTETWFNYSSCSLSCFSWSYHFEQRQLGFPQGVFDVSGVPQVFIGEEGFHEKFGSPQLIDIEWDFRHQQSTADGRSRLSQVGGREARADGRSRLSQVGGREAQHTVTDTPGQCSGKT